MTCFQKAFTHPLPSVGATLTLPLKEAAPGETSSSWPQSSLGSYLSQKEKGPRLLVSRGVWECELGDVKKGRCGRRRKEWLRNLLQPNEHAGLVSSETQQHDSSKSREPICGVTPWPALCLQQSWGRTLLTCVCRATQHHPWRTPGNAFPPCWKRKKCKYHLQRRKSHWSKEQRGLGQGLRDFCMQTCGRKRLF